MKGDRVLQPCCDRRAPLWHYHTVMAVALDEKDRTVRQFFAGGLVCTFISTPSNLLCYAQLHTLR